MKKRNARAGRVIVTGIFAGLPIAAAALVGVSYLAFAAVPPVPVPAQNPITEGKRILGKILFFDEQLSASNTVSCATCHSMSRGGADNRLATNPGPDGITGNADDRRGSPGVLRSDAGNSYLRDAVYNFAPQVTDRAANSMINAAFSGSLFWDGRALTTFVDPETGTVAIPTGGALESQCVGPPTNSVEMGHDSVQWAEVNTKLVRVRPLELATNLPPDVAARLAAKPSYPDLFQAAFGDSTISARRIAFAIATYERTLISDQAPFDAFQAGVPGALSQGQLAGFNTFQQNCAVCHNVQNGLLTDHTFRNIGLRPTTEDLGRQIVTGNPGDRGRFKVPSLRNVGLKRTFMHNGQFVSLTDVARFYARAPGAAPQFLDNRDPAVGAINFPPQAEAALVDFLSNALTDPRVAGQQFPFDRPTLFTERGDLQATIQGGGVPGVSGVPNIIAQGPAHVGNLDYRLGLFNARPGANAELWVSRTAPVGGVITLDQMVGATTTGSSGLTLGNGTVHWPLANGAVQQGEVIFAQWLIADPGAVGGTARSMVARIPVFCGTGGCPATCGSADFNGDGDVGTDGDIEAFFACLGGSCCATCGTADFNADGDVGTDADIEAFFRVLAGGSC